MSAALIATPLAKNCTPAIVAPAVVAEVVAVTVAVEPTATLAPLAGLVTLTVGAVPLVTTAVTAAEVVLLPTLSIATAVRVKLPTAVGVQTAVYGKLVSMVPRAVPFTKNWTLAMVPLGELAVAVRFCVVLTSTLPPSGVTATTGGAPAETLTAAEVVWMPLLSVATAVSA